MDFKAVNRRDCSQEDLDMATKGKTQKRNWISVNSNTKQRYKKQSYTKQN